MRLSHKKKLAHKRSGSAKGWALVLLSRRRISHISMMSVSINGEPVPAGSIGVANMLPECVGEVASNHDEASSAASDDYIAMGFTTSEPCVIVGEVASSPASAAPDSVDDANAPCIDADVAAAMQEVARSAAHTGGLMTKLVGAVSSTFRRLREAGAAQADIIRGRIG